jgi:hypothetical protein
MQLANATRVAASPATETSGFGISQPINWYVSTVWSHPVLIAAKIPAYRISPALYARYDVPSWERTATASLRSMSVMPHSSAMPYAKSMVSGSRPSQDVRRCRLIVASVVARYRASLPAVSR